LSSGTFGVIVTVEISEGDLLGSDGIYAIASEKEGRRLAVHLVTGRETPIGI
jgi:hypothetical protein